MAKLLKEDCKFISISKLKEWGYLEKGHFRAGSIVWTYSEEEKSNINFEIDLSDKYNMFIELIYRIRNFGDEWNSVRQKYPIVATPCHYGGERFWFICSVYRSGCYCGRRVGKLYLGSGSNYFACRHCYDLSYASRNENYSSFSRLISILFKANSLEENLKRRFYAGRPTRKYQRVLRMSRKLMPLNSLLDS